MSKDITTVRLEPDVGKAVRKLAKEEKRTFSNMVNYILESWIQSKMK